MCFFWTCIDAATWKILRAECLLLISSSDTGIMALAVLQAAQEFAFLSPSFDQQITPGQAVTVSWKSP